MRTILSMFLRRIPLEGFKSLSVPALAMALVLLVSIMDGARLRLTADLEYVMDNFDVSVELSNPLTAATENLGIDDFYIGLFTDETANHSLAEFLRGVEKQRALPIIETYPFVPIGQWTGITSLAADPRLDPMTGTEVVFFPGYDESIFRSREKVGIVSPGAFDAENPVLSLTVLNFLPLIADEDGNILQDEIFLYETTEIQVVGTVRGLGYQVFSPFLTVSDAAESVALPVYTGIMRAYMSENRSISDFADAAENRFAQVGDLHTQLPFALTIFAGTYNDIVRRLQQNIRIISVATPFIYMLSVLIGFIASYLLTRRRKPEFAIMRSIGVSKRHVFYGALIEQAFLCILGAAAGFAVFAAIQGNFLLLPPLIFTACYVSGSVFAAKKAAGTNVLKILREKE